MSIITPINNVEMKPSAYDKALSALVTGIIVIGVLAIVLFLVWLTLFTPHDRKAPAMYLAQLPADGINEGYEDDDLELGVEDFPEIETPALGKEIQTVSDSLAGLAESIDAFENGDELTGRGQGAGSANIGDGRNDAGVISEAKRWQVEYSIANVDAYAQQLSYFGIGTIIAESEKVTILFDPAGAKTITRMTTKEFNHSRPLMFAHRNKRLARWNQIVATNAGIDTTDKVTLELYSDTLRQQLRAIEQTYLQSKNRNLTEVKKIYFQIVPGSQKPFEIQVNRVVFPPSLSRVKESRFMDIDFVFGTLGIVIYTILFLVALWGGYSAFMVYNQIRQKQFATEGEQTKFLQAIEQTLQEGNYELTEELCDGDSRAISQMAQLAVKNRNLSFGKIQHLISDRFQRDVLQDIEHRLSWVLTVIKSAPMLGLLGTVIGMMGAFGKLSGAAGVKPETSALANDIMLALITTACGLAIAIPLVWAVSFINIRIRRLEDLATVGMNQFLQIFREALTRFPVKS